MNVRDLGGLPARHGETRCGALIRSDDLSLLTGDGVAAVRKIGVVRILDLRSRKEVEARPGPFAGDPIHCHVPLLADVLAYDPPAWTYAPMLDHNRNRIAQAFRALASAPEGAVVVHCRAGRDRTGGLIALALDIAGVRPEAIVADYARTAGADPAAMRNTLDHLTARYGGATAYLENAGVSASELARVRRRLAPGGRPTSPRSGRSATPASPPTT
ncbi:tyrosine-protein phosphatase [Actinoplanes sp. NPDC051411]|uniref:tyrosine-protein phosphatase n=1 Tax=Actinoplanes sp. NPDC051411 TaxID=3155522 RepID=UPI0034229DB4